MHEILRISKEYYMTCSSPKNFGRKVMYSHLPLMVVYAVLMTGFMTYGIKNNNVFLMLIGILFEFFCIKLVDSANEQHNYKTIKNINIKLNKNFGEKDILISKFFYLKKLTCNVSDDIYISMEKIDNTFKLHNKNNIARSYDNYMTTICRFLYDPESKNRVMSLIIYMLTILTIIFIVKNENRQEVVDTLFSALSYDFAVITLTISLFLLISFIVFIWLIKILYSVIISKLLLATGLEDYLVKNFMTALSNFSFFDPEIFSPTNDDIPNSLTNKVRKRLGFG